jgi:hypothetical protein
MVRNHNQCWCLGLAAALLLPGASAVHAQWQMQSSPSHASLRGIHSLGNGTIAWASGTNGTVLRTLDGGHHWTTCSVPSGAEKLDFRSIWAWSAERAMVMSSGPGQLSQLYSTQDGCRSWRLVFTNPDSEGFWDALQFDGTRFGLILGDPVRGQFTMFATYDGGVHWIRQSDPCLRPMESNQGVFAASNQSLAVFPIDESNSTPGFAMNHQVWFGTSGGWIYGFPLRTLRLVADSNDGCVHQQALPGLAGADAGVFAMAFRDAKDAVAVGGDYRKPDEGAQSAAYTMDGNTWRIASRLPSGYRSSVAWNGSDGSWIAAGPNGSDSSRDDGKTWQPMDRGNWNAISLPYVVGPDGRIGRLISWGQMRASGRAPMATVFDGN